MTSWKAHTGSITKAIMAYIGTRLQSQVATKRQFRQKLERISGILSHIQSVNAGKVATRRYDVYIYIHNIYIYIYIIYIYINMYTKCQ